MSRHNFKVGDRVILSALAKKKSIVSKKWGEKCHSGEGDITGFSRADGFPLVLWDGYATTMTLHPVFIEPSVRSYRLHLFDNPRL